MGRVIIMSVKTDRDRIREDAERLLRGHYFDTYETGLNIPLNQKSIENQKKAYAKVLECIDILSKRLGYTFVVPEVRFDMKGRFENC
jgi:hypothetical protein